MNPKWLQSGVKNILHTGAWWRGGELHMSFQLHLTSLFFLHKKKFSLVASSPFSKHLKSSQIGSSPELLFFAFVTRFNIQHFWTLAESVRNWIYIYIWYKYIYRDIWYTNIQYYIISFYHFYMAYLWTFYLWNPNESLMLQRLASFSH